MVRSIDLRRKFDGYAAAVTIQFGRAVRDEPGWSHDAQLFPVVLRRFVLHVEDLNRRFFAGQLDSALKAFKDAVPGWLNVRDVLEHLDAYAKGEGNLQKKGLVGRLPEQPHVLSTSRVNGSEPGIQLILAAGPERKSHSEFHLHLTEANLAAIALAGATYDAFEALAAVEEVEWEAADSPGTSAGQPSEEG